MFKAQAQSLKIGGDMWRTRACSVALRLVFSAAAPDLAGFVTALVFTADSLLPVHIDASMTVGQGFDAVTLLLQCWSQA